MNFRDLSNMNPGIICKKMISEALNIICKRHRYVQMEFKEAGTEYVYQ